MTEPPIIESSAGRPAERPSTMRKALDNRPLLLCMLFFVTAALGLPLLWKSRAFSRQEKIVWSVVVSLYTVLILAIFSVIMWWSYTRIRDSLLL